MIPPSLLPGLLSSPFMQGRLLNWKRQFWNDICFVGFPHFSLCSETIFLSKKKFNFVAQLKQLSTNFFVILSLKILFIIIVRRNKNDVLCTISEMHCYAIIYLSV
jgi:hypothetical protein